jgi:hypothetical protein
MRGRFRSTRGPDDSAVAIRRRRRARTCGRHPRDVRPIRGTFRRPQQAAAAFARLDALLTGHPLAAAWRWRIRLYAVRRHAACDGLMIDPWHLAAVIEGVRFRMDGAAAIIDRGAIFEAARHAFRLWRWFVQPDAAQTQAIERAVAALSANRQASPLLGAALGVRLAR